MRKLLFFLALGFILSGCDKIKKNQKQLTGIWSIHEYQYTAPTGLIYFYESTGTMSFGSCGDKTCDYTIRIDYTNQGSSYQKYESGTMEFQDEEYFIMNRVNPNASITMLDYARILLITKDDLKLEFQDEYGLHEFVLQK